MGVAAAALTLAGGIWFLVEDPLNIFPGGGSVPAGGYEILNTYTISQRYFFQGLEFVKNGEYLLYSEGWRGSSSVGLLKMDKTKK